MIEASVDIQAIFPSLSQGEQPWIQYADKIKTTWQKNLLTITEKLNNIDSVNKIVLADTKNAFEAFSKHPDHGIHHSVCVYAGMIYLARQSGWSEEEIIQADSLFQTEAVLHDLAQFLPNRDWQTGEQLQTDQRKDHAKRIAYLARFLGTDIGLSRITTRELSRSMLHHDDTWMQEGPPYTHISPIGELLADSDKLFGTHLPNELGEYDDKALVKDALERNLAGSSGEKGWYLFRKDLTPEQRESWQYGDRWLADGVSAIHFQFFRQPMYTAAGSEMLTRQQAVFWEVAQDVYGELWEKQHGYIENSTPPYTIISRDYSEKTHQSIGDLIQILQERPVKATPRGNLTNPRGWKILITENENTHIIDPSIVRFSTKQEFLEALEETFYPERRSA